MISGSPMPGADCQYVYPPELQDELETYCPEAAVDEVQFHATPYEDAERMVDLFERNLDRRFSTFLDLISADQYDLNAFWIGRTDSLQHWI